ncbi:MAG: tetratricopeptide repeat protein [Spirochaetaceae bacterium]|nr:tetratricopeptide repeat protein [Spirochaetaceae bacterium]
MTRENAETLNTQAIELAAQGDYNEAIACFKRAISIEKSNILLWYNLGITYRDLGDLELARTTLEYANDLAEGEDEEILETLSLLCFTIGIMDEAFAYCMDGLALNDKNPHLWNNLGVLFFNNTEYEDACYAFENAVSLCPYYYDALFNLRDTYIELENDAGAEECERRMSGLFPGDSSLA